MRTKKIGRPTDSPKDTMIRVRMDRETVEKLDECVEKLSSNRSDAIRQGIDKLYDDLKKEK